MDLLRVDCEVQWHKIKPAQAFGVSGVEFSEDRKNKKNVSQDSLPSGGIPSRYVPNALTL
jgi:hypothetical protein